MDQWVWSKDANNSVTGRTSRLTTGTFVVAIAPNCRTCQKHISPYRDEMAEHISSPVVFGPLSSIHRPRPTPQIVSLWRDFLTAIVAIPARLKSTRFPRKVLADIFGQPMLWYVYQAVSKAKTISEVWVLSDSQEVLDVASSWGAKTLITSEECPSGTDRIASVMDSLDAETIVNVQADEPLIDPAVVDRLVQALEDSEADVATPVYPITTIDEITNSNVVKVVRSHDGAALYFSRSPVPHVRDVNINDWLAHSKFWGHAGVYAYRNRVLREFPSLPEGQLEKVEKLEQLRLLESGREFLTVEIDYRPQAVDVPEDLETVKRILKPGS